MRAFLVVEQASKHWFEPRLQTAGYLLRRSILIVTHFDAARVDGMPVPGWKGLKVLIVPDEPGFAIIA
jgi:hypothetical protein